MVPVAKSRTLSGLSIDPRGHRGSLWRGPLQKLGGMGLGRFALGVAGRAGVHETPRLPINRALALRSVHGEEHIQAGAGDP